MKAPDSLQFEAETCTAASRVLSSEAADFLVRLLRAFEPVRQRLLQARGERQASFDRGAMPGYLASTQAIRAGAWQVPPVPRELSDRRVLLVSGLHAADLVQAANSGAKVVIADFEDFTVPRWEIVMEGQLSLMEAARRTLAVESPGGSQSFPQRPPPLVVRPRGLHMVEKNVTLDGAPVSAALLDFGLYFFHNARELLKRGSGPYFCLSKLESHLEARMWNDVFRFSEDAVAIPQGSIKATAIIETVPAAFEMEEILYELREHAAGLGFGQWDYVASFVRTFQKRPDAVLPEGASIHAMLPLLRSAKLSLVKACHVRNAHAIGQTSAQYPVRGNNTANEAALNQVYGEKEREASEGFDGSCVAHPGLVGAAMEAFDSLMPTPNQIQRKREDLRINEAELLQPPTGPLTEEGVRTSIRCALHYLNGWLQGEGRVVVDGIVENAATVEVARSQLWQWITYRSALLDERLFCVELFDQLLEEAVAEIHGGDPGRHPYARTAASLLRELVSVTDLNTPWTAYASVSE